MKIIPVRPLARLRLLLAASIATAWFGNASASPYVLAYTDDGDPRSYANLQAFHANLTAVALGNAYAMKADGTIDSSGVTVNTTHVIAYAKSHDLALFGTVSDFNNTIQNWDPSITQTVEKTTAAATTR